MRGERWRADRLDTRLAQGRLDVAQVRSVAAQLAGAHRAQAPVPSSEARISVSKIDAAISALRERLAARGHDLDGVAAACDRLVRLVAIDRMRFEARAAAGAIRPIYGALEPSDIFVDSAGRVSIAAPRPAEIGDVAADVARIAVELRRQRRPDLAERFVAAYAEAADDFALYPVLGFHESLAALALAARVPEAVDARCWLAAAQRPILAARPQLVAVGGRAASGKSTVAHQLAAELCAPIVSAHLLSDFVGDEWSLALALARRAAPALDAGRSVVLDATFASQAARRALARLARERGAPFLFAECRALESTRRRRLAARPKSLAASSEWEPVRDLEGGIHVVIDTSRAEPRGFARVRRMLPAATSLVA